MPYRAAVLSVALSALVALSLPLRAQNGPGDLINNITVPGSPVNTNSGLLSDSGSISGTVNTSDHHAASDARIEIRNIATGAITASGYVNRNGSFTLKGLPAGTYEVLATSGLSEAREQVQISGIDSSVNLILPHTGTNDQSGDKTVSVSELRVPDKARHELDKARDAAKKNNIEEARKRIEKALAIEPKYADALVLRGIIELQDNNLGPASQDFNEALQYDPSSAMAYIGSGAVCNMEGRYDDALRELDRGVALNPTAWQAQFEMARANLGKGDFEAALRNANKAADMAPADFTPIHVVKGHALLGMKEYSSAVSEFEAFLSKDGQSPDAASVRQELQEAKSFVSTANLANAK